MSAREDKQPGQPYLRWHHHDAPYLRRKRLRLEASLGAACFYCGLTREDGCNLQFHHPKGRHWTDSKGRPTSPRQLSWSQRLTRYKAEIKAGLLTLACDDTGPGNDCHGKARKGLAPHEAEKLYEYPAEAAGSAPEQPF